VEIGLKINTSVSPHLYIHLTEVNDILSPLDSIRALYLEPYIRGVNEYSLYPGMMAGQELGIDHAVCQDISKTFIGYRWNMFHIVGQRVCNRTQLYPFKVKKTLICLKELSLQQPLREKTKASHAAVLYNSKFEILAVAEDVGRHNALDKAIGKVFLERTLSQVVLAILSSRISYELVQKAARAHIPIILAHSRPTALAVELASQLNISLASLDDDDEGLYIFCGEQRLQT